MIVCCVCGDCSAERYVSSCSAEVGFGRDLTCPCWRRNGDAVGARTAGGALLLRGPLAAGAGGPRDSTPPALKHSVLLKIPGMQQSPL